MRGSDTPPRLRRSLWILGRGHLRSRPIRLTIPARRQAGWRSRKTAGSARVPRSMRSSSPGQDTATPADRGRGTATADGHGKNQQQQRWRPHGPPPSARGPAAVRADRPGPKAEQERVRPKPGEAVEAEAAPLWSWRRPSEPSAPVAASMSRCCCAERAKLERQAMATAPVPSWTRAQVGGRGPGSPHRADERQLALEDRANTQLSFLRSHRATGKLAVQLTPATTRRGRQLIGCPEELQADLYRQLATLKLLLEHTPLIVPSRADRLRGKHLLRASSPPVPSRFPAPYPTSHPTADGTSPVTWSDLGAQLDVPRPGGSRAAALAVVVVTICFPGRQDQRRAVRLGSVPLVAVCFPRVPAHSWPGFSGPRSRHPSNYTRWSGGRAAAPTAAGYEPLADVARSPGAWSASSRWSRPCSVTPSWSSHNR